MSDHKRDAELRSLIDDVAERRAPASTPPAYSKDSRYEDVRRDLETVCAELEAREFVEDWVEPWDIQGPPNEDEPARERSNDETIALVLNERNLTDQLLSKQTVAQVRRSIQDHPQLKGKSPDTLRQGIQRYYDYRGISPAKFQRKE